MRDQVAVIGVGCTKFGDLFETSYEDLICDAAFEAYADAGIDPQDIEAAYLGTYLPGPSGGKAAVSLADALKLYDRPITRVENYCATGTDAFRNGCLAIASGLYDVMLVLVAGETHRNGARNEKAHLRREVPGNQVLKPPIPAWPFGLFDCCPTTGGAAA